jgi:hypothetical protein
MPFLKSFAQKPWNIKLQKIRAKPAPRNYTADNLSQHAQQLINRDVRTRITASPGL